VTTREELHRRIMIVREALEGGRLHFAPELLEQFRQSLGRVRIAEDGLVDPDTVDGRVRAMALAMAHQHDREELKKAVSLKDVQRAYFSRVEGMFGELYEIMMERHASPEQVAAAITKDDAEAQIHHATIVSFLAELEEFWEAAADSAWAHSEDQRAIKVMFAGAIVPSTKNNPASVCGIYVDTIYIPDPFLKLGPLLTHKSPAEQVYDVVRFGLNILGYKDLALADVDPPIVAVLPDRFAVEDWYRKSVYTFAERDAVRHLSWVFGRDFEGAEEARAFLSTLSTPDQVVAALRQPDGLLFATEWTEPLAAQIERYTREDASIIGVKTVGEAVWMNAVTRMSQANDSSLKSSRLHAIPLIQAETSWKWFNWMLEYGSIPSPEANSHLHTVRALQAAAGQDIEWLGRVPPDVLIDIRKQGALPELRSLLGQGISELVASDPSNFFATSDRVQNNLIEGLRRHEQELRELRKQKWIFAGKDLSQFLVTGGIAFAAAITSDPRLAVITAAAAMTGRIPSAKDVMAKYDGLKAEGKALQSSPLGLLFRAKR
jgi:hypothetical protein